MDRVLPEHITAQMEANELAPRHAVSFADMSAVWDAVFQWQFSSNPEDAGRVCDVVGMLVYKERGRCAALVEKEAAHMLGFKRIDNAEALMDLARRIRTKP
jgi:hypothetical protein